MSHLTDEQLSALRDAALEGAALERARHHLASCAECREALATLEQVDAALARSLAYDPGERYFESFASRVTERIAAEDRAAAAPRRSTRAGTWGWLLSPRGLSLAGSAAAVLVVGALVYFQNQPGMDVHRAALRSRSEQVAPEQRDRLQKERSDRSQTNESDELRSMPSDAARNVAPSEEERRQAVVQTPAAPGTAAQRPHATPSPGEFAPAPQQEGATALEKSQAADGRAPTSSSTAPPAAAQPPAAGARAGASAGAMTRVERTQRGEEVPSKKLAAPARESAPVTGSSSVALKPEAQVMSGRAADSANRFDASPQIATAAPEARDRASLDSDVAGMVQLCGRVTDAEGRAVSGAEVAIADVGRSVTAGADGRFCVTAPPGEHTISVLRVGYAPLRQTITAGATSAPMTLALHSVPVLQSGGSGGSAFGFSQEPKAGSAPGVRWTGGWPAPVLQDVALAESTTELAARTRSAARYEDAARIWERVLTRLGSPAAQLEARDRIGESRWLAWQLDRTRPRAANARTALTAFLTLRPRGVRADLARERLAALGR